MTYEEALAVATANNEIDENQTFLIDKNLRTVTIPDGFVLGVFNDKNVQIVPFAMPRYYNGIDMSTFAIQVNYVNSAGDGDIYLVFDQDVQEDLILFNWVVDRTAFATSGKTGFVVCMKEDDEYGYVAREFNTTLAYAPVLDGLEIDNPIDDQEVLDVLTQIRRAAERADIAAQQAEDSAAQASTDATTASNAASSASTSADTATAAQQSASASATLASTSEANALSYRNAAAASAESAAEIAAELATSVAVPNALFNKEASGNPIVFDDGADDVPVRELITKFSPIQDLNGYSKPWSGGGGKNICDDFTESSTCIKQGEHEYKIIKTGTTIAGRSANADCALKANVSYIISLTADTANISGLTIAVRAHTVDGENTGRISLISNGANEINFTPTKDVEYLNFYLGTESESIGAYVIVKNLMVRLASETDDTYEPYTNICPIEGRIGMTVTRSGKNLLSLPYAEASKTQNGITFTVNDDGSIRVAGTATGTATLILANTAALNELQFLGSDATVTLSGCPSGGSSSTYYMTANFAGDNTGDVGASNLVDTGAGDTKYYTNTHVKSNGNLFIRVTSGTTIDKVFYPMLALADSVSEWESPKDKKIIPVSWESEAGVVYGGTLNLTTGKLTVDRGCFASTEYPSHAKSSSTSFDEYYFRITNSAMLPKEGTSSNTDIICSHAIRGSVAGATYTQCRFTANQPRILFPAGAMPTVSDFDAWLADQVSAGTPLQFSYVLATPQTYQLTPEELKTLKGFNQIYSDGDSNSVKYLADAEDATSGVVADRWAIKDEASGEIAAFSDGADNVPMKSVVAEITPIQDLNGQDNPYPPGGGKNLLNNTAQTTTAYGITWTVNSDGTVTANGTATSDSQLFIPMDGIKVETNLYFGACPSGGSSTKYAVNIWNITDNKRANKWDNITASDYDYGTSMNNQLYLESGKSYRMTLRIRSGQTVSNLVFKPMIRLASVTDGTYAPYSNICPISGRTGMTIDATAANIWDGQTTVGGYYDATGAWRTDSSVLGVANAIPVRPGMKLYCHSANGAEVYVSLFSRMVTIGTSATDAFISRTRRENQSFTIPDGVECLYFNFAVAYGTTYQNDVSINYPATVQDMSTTARLIPIDWQTEAGTIYGGTLDVVSGVLTVEYGKYTIPSDISVTDRIDSQNRVYWNFTDMMPGAYLTDRQTVCNRLPKSGPTNEPTAPCICIGAASNASYVYLQGVKLLDGVTNLATLRTWLEANPVEFTYKLATPQTYQLTPTEVKSILGDNTVYSDVGDIAVEYVADFKRYINKKIAEALA